MLTSLDPLTLLLWAYEGTYAYKYGAYIYKEKRKLVLNLYIQSLP